MNPKTVLAFLPAFACLAVSAATLVDGSELVVPAGETCTVSGAHTIPTFTNNGVLTLDGTADLTVSGSTTAAPHVVGTPGVNGTLNLESGARLVATSYDKNLSNQIFVGGYLGGTGTINVASGAYLSAQSSSERRFRLASNSADDRTRPTYGILNVAGTAEISYLEMAAFWRNDISDTNLYTRASEVNVLPGGRFRANVLIANDASISRINLRGGTWYAPAENYAYMSTGFGALLEVDFAEGTTSTIETTGHLTLNTAARISLSGSGTLVKKGAGILCLHRPNGQGYMGFTGDIRVEAGSVFLGRPLVEGQSVYVCKGAGYQLAVPEDADHITYEDEADKPAAGGLYTVSADVAGGIDLLSLPDFDHDRLGGPIRAVTATVGGAVTHDAATVDHPFTLVGQYYTAVLNLLNTDIDRTPIRLEGAGIFNFAGDRVLTPADASNLQFAGGTYGKTGTVEFKTGDGSYAVENGSIRANKIYIGSDGVNGEVRLANGSFTASDLVAVGSNVSGDRRAHTTGTLTVTNGTVSSVNAFRLGANGLTDGSSKGGPYGVVRLQAGGVLQANIIANDEGYERVVFEGGEIQPRSTYGEVFAVNQDGVLDVVAAAGHAITVNSGATTNDLALSASTTVPQIHFTGPGGFRKKGKGMLKIGSVGFDMDYAGDTVLEDGVTRLDCDNPFPSGAGKGVLDLPGTGVLDLHGHVLTVNAVQGGLSASAIRNSSADLATLAVGADGRDGVFSAGLAENVTLAKEGAGSLELRTGLPKNLVVRGGSVRLQPTAFRHFRFKVEKAYGPNANSMQIGEFRLLDGDVDVTRPYAAVSRSGTGKDSPANEQPVKAVDGVLTTKYLDFNAANNADGSDALRDTCWLQLDYDAPVRATAYSWATGNDCHTLKDKANRSPTSWRLQGSLDGTTWIDLDVRTDYVQPHETPSAWVDTFELAGAGAAAANASIQVAADATLDFSGEYALGALEADGAVALREGAVASFESGTVGGTVAGPGEIVKTGDGTLGVDPGPGFTAPLRVEAGTVVFGKGVAGKWFRLTVRKTYSGGDAAMQISEFKLLDAKGGRVNLGLTAANPGTDAARLVPGTFCKAAAYDAGRTTEDADKLFDGDTGTKWCATNVGQLKNGNEADWRTITLRLAADAAPVTAYNFTTANDNVYRSPSSWLLETSADGVTWTVLDDRVDVPVTTTLFTDFNGGTPYAIARSGESASCLAAPVSVAAGATVDVLDENLQFTHLRIDCAAGAGAFTRLNFAPSGVIEIANAGTLGARLELPLAVPDARNAQNAASWRVVLDGVEKGGRRLSVSNGRLVLVASGMTVFIR